jgi:hypothetical protein
MNREADQSQKPKDAHYGNRVNRGVFRQAPDALYWNNRDNKEKSEGGRYK